MKKTLSAAALSLFMPLLTFAQGTGAVPGTFIFNFLNFAELLIKRLFPIGIAIAGLVFIYELIMFIVTKEEGGDKSTKFKKGILYSLLALFIMLTFWGLIRTLANAFGLNLGDDITSRDIPTVQL